METVAITINDMEVEARKGSKILEAAIEAGIYIPNLCYLRGLRLPTGACRLCFVEVEGWREPATSCTETVREGMKIRTDSPAVLKLQRRMLELLLTKHPHWCLTCNRTDLCQNFDICLRTVAVEERCVLCPKNGRCELQKVVLHIGLEEVRLPYTYRSLPVLTDNPFFDRNYNLCIYCGRCVRVCNEVIGAEAIDFTHRGGEVNVGTAFGQTLRDAGCRFDGSCVEVCPTGALIERVDKWHPRADREAALVPCHGACPAGIDVPRYVRLIGEGKPAEALAVIREKVPFPGVLGRVCLHPCEAQCRRGQLNDSIAIRLLKRFAAEHDTGLWRQSSKVAPATGKRVAVVGSGPAGLTAAYYLAKQGHSVTVFEALPEPGGMMRVGNPEYRLPKAVLDAEIEVIKERGVDIKTNTRIESLDELFGQGYNAIFVALGAHQGSKLAIPGEDLPGVIDAITLLREVTLGQQVRIGQRVAVVGGANSALIAARTALRLGAKEATVLYENVRDEISASSEEVEEALQEGVKIVDLIAPTRIAQGNGALRVECIRMRLSEPDASGRRHSEPIVGSDTTFEVDNLIAAVGRAPEIPAQLGLTLDRDGRIQAASETMGTSREGVFAGGDVATSPASVIEAIAAGRKAAASIDRYLGGDGDIEEVLIPRQKPNYWLGHANGFADRTRPQVPTLASEQRLSGFAEVELGFNEEMAIAEAKRCFQCDLRLYISEEMLLPVELKLPRLER